MLNFNLIFVVAAAADVFVVVVVYFVCSLRAINWTCSECPRPRPFLLAGTVSASVADYWQPSGCGRLVRAVSYRVVDEKGQLKGGENGGKGACVLVWLCRWTLKPHSMQPQLTSLCSFTRYAFRNLTKTNTTTITTEQHTSNNNNNYNGQPRTTLTSCTVCCLSLWLYFYVSVSALSVFVFSVSVSVSVAVWETLAGLMLA